MPLYRVEAGVLVQYRLGVVTPLGVDFGAGPISGGAIQVRLHDASVVAMSGPTAPVSVRLHEASIGGSAPQTIIHLYETDYLGVSTTPGPVALTDRLPSPL